MKMMLEDIRRLSAAVKDAGEDFFCAVGVLPEIRQALDAFSLRDETTLLALPGAFALPDETDARSLAARFRREGKPGSAVYRLTDRVIAADVRLLGDTSFREWFAGTEIGRILVPFAELADPSEYGGRGAYGWIGELRAELPREVRVTALFSEPQPDYGPFLARFASPGCTVIDASVAPPVYAFETAEVRKKYAYTLSLAERRATRRTAVFFTDRREAEEFRRFLERQGRHSLSVHGGMTAAEQKAALDAFSRYEGLLVATKSVIPYAPFYRADDVIYCGVPYSTALMTRCASFSAEGELTCCFCRADFETDRKILRHFADNLPEEEREGYLDTGEARLSAVRSILCETDPI